MGGVKMDEIDMEKEKIEVYDAQLEGLKDSIKKLKKLRKKKEKIQELEKEKSELLKHMERKHK
jgi:prefoldin subunit 5